MNWLTIFVLIIIGLIALFFSPMDLPVLIVIGIIVLLFARRSSSSTKPKPSLEQVLERLSRVENRLDSLERHVMPPAPTTAQTGPEPIAAPSEEIAEAISPLGQAAIPEEPAPSIPAPVHEAPPAPVSWEIKNVAEVPLSHPPEPARPTDFEKYWRRIEQLFMENWTGILGAAVVIAGVTFLGIYTALRLEPFSRFLMTVAAATALGGTSVYLHRYPAWQKLAEWVRSAAAAVFLFACAASGGLPGLGMQWIEAPTPALALLLLGMAVNLYLAWSSKAQTFASLHVVFSLLPLVIVPQSAMSLGIASVVSIFGVALSFRARWDQHLLIVIASYVLYHASWYLRLGDDLDAMGLRSYGILSTISVFATAALVHYRKDYLSKKVEPLPLLVHISNWALLALSLLVYLTEPAMRGFALSVSGIIAYLLARRARPMGIRWLYLSDTLIGQTLVVAALLSLHPIIANFQLILLAIFLETMLFLRLVIDEDEDVLVKVAWLSTNCAGVLFALGGIYNFDVKSDLKNQNAFILLAGAVAATAVHLYLVRKHSMKLDKLESSPLSQASMGWLIGAIVIVGLLSLIENVWMEAVALLVTGSLLYVSRAMSPPGLLAGSGAVMIAVHLMSWLMLLSRMPWEVVPLAQHIGPLIALAGFGIWAAGPVVLRQVAIYLVGIDSALAAYLFFNPVSSLIPGVAWLIMSLLALEFANRLERPNSISALYLGYGYLCAFVGAYALVIIQAPAYIGLVRMRLLIELFGLGVILYWWLYHPRQALSEQPAWLRTHPFLLEFALIAIATTNIVEVPAQWRPLVWPLLGLVLLAKPLIKYDGRLQFYSLVFFWVAVADVAVIMSTFELPSPRWYDQPDIMSGIGILLQVAYIVISHTRLNLSDIRFPSELGALGSLGKLIAARRNLWVYYPFFAGVALFLFWRFDRSLLTLLWAAEAFMVFVLSAVLRENQFRHVALAALGMCLARLLFIDMAESNLGLRGLIFVGVGLLMLGMNAVYNRYRARFQ